MRAHWISDSISSAFQRDHDRDAASRIRTIPEREREREAEVIDALARNVNRATRVIYAGATRELHFGRFVSSDTCRSACRDFNIYYVLLRASRASRDCVSCERSRDARAKRKQHRARHRRRFLTLHGGERSSSFRFYV
jgi:hypothetical protein